MERFFDCSIFLRKHYPEYFPNIYDDEFFKLDFKETKEKISQNIRKKIKNYLLDDQKLYDLVNTFLDKEISKVSKSLETKKLKQEIKYKYFYRRYSMLSRKVIDFLIRAMLFFFKPILKKFFK